MSVDYELYQMRRELSNIIDELDRISDGVRRDFAGIGNEDCASAIAEVANQYRYVKRKLDNIDTTLVTSAFANKGGGGHRI